MRYERPWSAIHIHGYCLSAEHTRWPTFCEGTRVTARAK